MDRSDPVPEREMAAALAFLWREYPELTGQGADPLIFQHQVCALAGARPETVHQWRLRSRKVPETVPGNPRTGPRARRFPQPAAEKVVGGGQRLPVWRTSEIVDWLWGTTVYGEHRRWYDSPAWTEKTRAA